MRSFSRRDFLEISAAGVLANTAGSAAEPADRGKEKKMRLGLIVHLGHDPEGGIRKVHDLGIPTCQAGVQDFSAEMEARLRDALKKYGIEATALNTSGPGPHVYDFYQGPLTIGVVPRQYRRQRIDHLKKASDFAKRLGIPAVHTHCGFIPEDPNDPLYGESVEAIREVVAHCNTNEQTFLYETGQETPITLLRTIKDVGLDNQAINLDTANLILYGKGHPLDALDAIGSYVQGLHAKDGLFPRDPKQLGEEVPIGQGRVNFPQLFKRLKEELNYRGPVTIEREIEGSRQVEDIRKSIQFLEKLMA